MKTLLLRRVPAGKREALYYMEVNGGYKDICVIWNGFLVLIVVRLYSNQRSGKSQGIPLQWRYNERDGVSNHQPYDCLFNSLLRRRSKKTKAPRHWPLCGEFSGDRWVSSPLKWPVTREMFPFDDAIMFQAR